MSQAPSPSPDPREGDSGCSWGEAERSIEATLTALGLHEPARVAALIHYLRELERWNRTYNLTSVREPAAMATQHIADSLALSPLVQGVARWLDVGSGAGLPGVPLAVVRPDDAFTLVDSRGKKVRFLNHVVRTLKLTNVRPVQLRIEDFLPRPGVDIVVARAFGSLRQLGRALAAWCQPHTRVLAMKGAVPDEEIAALSPDFQVHDIHALKVPGLNAARHVVELRRR